MDISPKKRDVIWLVKGRVRFKDGRCIPEEFRGFILKELFAIERSSIMNNIRKDILEKYNLISKSD